MTPSTHISVAALATAMRTSSYVAARWAESNGIRFEPFDGQRCYPREQIVELLRAIADLVEARTKPTA